MKKVNIAENFIIFTASNQSALVTAGGLIMEALRTPIHESVNLEGQAEAIAAINIIKPVFEEVTRSIPSMVKPGEIEDRLLLVEDAIHATIIKHIKAKRYGFISPEIYEWLKRLEALPKVAVDEVTNVELPIMEAV
jgi:hypothetical protein